MTMSQRFGRQDFAFGQCEEETCKARLDASLIGTLDFDEAHVRQRSHYFCGIGEIDLRGTWQGNGVKTGPLDNYAGLAKSRQQNLEPSALRPLNPVLHFRESDCFPGRTAFIGKSCHVSALRLNNFNEIHSCRTPCRARASNQTSKSAARSHQSAQNRGGPKQPFEFRSSRH